MATRTELKRSYNRVSKLNSELIIELGSLSALASKLLGYDVVADLCNGDEIEFRRVLSDGRPDSDDCIRIEDLLGKTK